MLRQELGKARGNATVRFPEVGTLALVPHCIINPPNAAGSFIYPSVARLIEYPVSVMYKVSKYVFKVAFILAKENFFKAKDAALSAPANSSASAGVEYGCFE